MKKATVFRRICYLITVLMLMVTGCGANKETDSEEASNEETVSDEAELSGEEELYELEYTDIVLDRTKTEGKLAVYFFRGNDLWKTWRGGEHDGDSVLVITPDGTTLLYDCNTPNHGANIVHALQRLGIDKIDYFVNSHPHIDHLGGFPVLAKHIEIGHVYTSAEDLTYVTGNNGRYYRKMIAMMEELGIPHSFLQEGDSFMLGEDVKATVYNPPSPEEFNYNSVNENEISILLKLTYGESSYIMGGDIGNPDNNKTEEKLIAKYGSELHADVAKVNHHMMPGGDNPSTDGWLQTIDAKLWVGQMSTLPDDFEYFRFRQLDATILHTSLDGAIVVSTTGDGTYDVQMEREHPSEMYGSLDAVNGYMKVE